MIIGIVGKPNSGKSTFFKALTLAEVAIANYPFTTIEKNEGVAYVKVHCVEKEFGVKCQPRFGFCIDGNRFIPVKIIDVAGLVPGAHAGKGRGNQFLDDLSEADVLIHVLDASGRTDEEGKPTQNYDVTKDVSFLQEEIDLWLHAIVGKNWQRFARKVHGEQKKLSEELAKQLSGLKISEEVIIDSIKELNLSGNPIEWKEEDLLAFTRRVREKSKPIIIAANKIDIADAEENLEELRETFPVLPIFPCSAESELALREAAKHALISYIPGASSFEIKKELMEGQKKGLDFIQKNVLQKFKNTGVQQCINDAIFSILRMIVAYPVENETKLTDKDGRILPDAYLLQQNSNAFDLAEKVHTDIAKNFVAAIDVRSKRRIARDYKLRNGDVVKIMTR